MELPDPLGHSRIAAGMALEQVFGLIFEVVEVGI
jgi:hypothetical protein